MGYYCLKKLIGFSFKKTSPNGHRAVVTGSHRILASISATMSLTIAIIIEWCVVSAKSSVKYFTDIISLALVGSHWN